MSEWSSLGEQCLTAKYKRRHFLKQSSKPFVVEAINSNIKQNQKQKMFEKKLLTQCLANKRECKINLVKETKAISEHFFVIFSRWEGSQGSGKMGWSYLVNSFIEPFLIQGCATSRGETSSCLLLTHVCFHHLEGTRRARSNTQTNCKKLNLLLEQIWTLFYNQTAKWEDGNFHPYLDDARRKERQRKSKMTRIIKISKSSKNKRCFPFLFLGKSFYFGARKKANFRSKTTTFLREVFGALFRLSANR